MLYEVITIGTPGRIADHLRRETFSTGNVRILVLDEFDKSLEVGFEAEMSEIIGLLPGLKKKVLTSATMHASVPVFVGLKKPKVLNFLGESESQLTIKTIISPAKDKFVITSYSIHYTKLYETGKRLKYGDGQFCRSCNIL